MGCMTENAEAGSNRFNPGEFSCRLGQGPFRRKLVLSGVCFQLFECQCEDHRNSDLQHVAQHRQMGEDRQGVANAPSPAFICLNASNRTPRAAPQGRCL
ncbi:hypothetical protein ABIB75_008092 [Bradyrhizobium sp. GM2.2]